MVRTVISMNSIDQALRDAHDSRDDDSGHPAAFREVYDQWMQFRAAQLKAVLREADYAGDCGRGGGRQGRGGGGAGRSTVAVGGKADGDRRRVRQRLTVGAAAVDMVL